MTIKVRYICAYCVKGYNQDELIKDRDQRTYDSVDNILECPKCGSGYRYFLVEVRETI